MNNNTKNATALDLLERWNVFWAHDFRAEDTRDAAEIAFFRYYGKQALKLVDVDPSHTLGLLYLKYAVGQLLERHCSDILGIALRICQVDEVKELCSALFSCDMEEQEREFLIQVSNEICAISGIQLLDDVPSSKDIYQFLKDISTVVELLDELHPEAYRKGCPNCRNLRLNTTVQLFRTREDLIAALEEAEDGIYLAYVNNHASKENPDFSDYLGFYVKVGDNLYGRADKTYLPEPLMLDRKMPQELYDFVKVYRTRNEENAYTKQVVSRSRLSIEKLNLRVKIQLLWAAWCINKVAVTK